MNWGILAGIIGGAVLGASLPGIGAGIGASLGGAVGGKAGGGGTPDAAAGPAGLAGLFGPQLSFGQRAGLGVLGGGLTAVGEILGEKEKGAQAIKLKQTPSYSPETFRQLQAATGPAPDRTQLLNRVKGLMGQAGSPQLALSRSVTSFGRGGV